MPVSAATCGAEPFANGYFFSDYEFDEYSPDGFLIQHFRLLPEYADGRAFSFTWGYRDDECEPSSLYNLSPFFGVYRFHIALPPHVVDWSVRWASRTHFDIWDDEHDVIIYAQDTDTFPPYTSVQASGTVDGGGSALTSRTLLIERDGTAPLATTTLAADPVCPAFSAGGYYFDSYEHAEYVDGLLRVHLRLHSPYNDGRTFRMTPFTVGADCDRDGDAPSFFNAIPSVFFAPHMRYYSLRMTSATHWMLWNDETNQQITCEPVAGNCEGDIATSSPYVALYGTIDGGVSFMVTTPFRPTEYIPTPAFILSYAAGAEYADDAESPGVDLNRGTASSTPFTFKVAYSSADNSPPDTINLVLDASSGVPRIIPLTIDLETPASSSATTTYATTLILPRGVHEYHFEATRGTKTVRLPEAGDLTVDAGLYVRSRDLARILAVPDPDALNTLVGTVNTGDVVEVLPMTADCPTDGTGECNNSDIAYRQTFTRNAKGNITAAYVMLKVRFHDRSDGMTEKIGFMVEGKMQTIVPGNQAARVQKLIGEEREHAEYNVLDNFPIEVFLALVSLESAGTFNNEVSSVDSPFSGIKQVHPSLSGGWNRNCTGSFPGEWECNRAQNGFNWRGTDLSIPMTDVFGTPITEKDDIVYMGKNYIGTLYNNTEQGLRDNIHDGFDVLKEKFAFVHTPCSSGAGNTTIEGVTVSCDEKEIIKSLWRYNGFVDGKETTDYLPSIASRLTSLGNYFIGPFVDTTHLQQALRVASRHKTVVQKFSPVYLQVYDAHGNVAGEFADGVRNTIFDAVVDTDSEAITIFFPEDQGIYTYRAVAFETGSYGLDIEVTNGDATTTVSLKNVPVTQMGETHEYAIDPDAIAQGEPGVTQKIDANGDGTFETTHILYADGTPADITPPEARITFATSTNQIMITGFDETSTTTVATTATSTIITDVAGNALTLAIVKNSTQKHSVSLIIPAFTYSTGTTTVATTSLRYVWTTHPRTGRYNVFVSHIKTPTERLLAVYIGSLNRTIVVDARVEDESDDDLAVRAVSLLKRRVRTALPGLVIPHVETRQGSVMVQY